MDRLAATSMCAGSLLCVKDMQTRLLAEVQPFRFQQAVQSMTIMDLCSQVDILTNPSEEVDPCCAAKAALAHTVTDSGTVDM